MSTTKPIDKEYLLKRKEEMEKTWESIRDRYFDGEKIEVEILASYMYSLNHIDKQLYCTLKIEYDEDSETFYPDLS
jgi:hypothetical protein